MEGLRFLVHLFFIHLCFTAGLTCVALCIVVNQYWISNLGTRDDLARRQADVSFFVCNLYISV